MSAEKLKLYINEDHVAPWESPIRENREIYDLALDIKNTYKLQIDLEEIKNIIRYLIEQKGKTIEEIKEGKANEELISLLDATVTKASSVKTRSTNEKPKVLGQRYVGKYEKVEILDVEGEAVKIPLDVSRKSLPRNVVAIILVATIGISNAVMVIEGIVNKIEKNKELLDSVSSNLGTIAAMYGEENSKSIVEQCRYIAGEKDGVPIWATDIDAIASKIKIVALTNPQLFDLCLADVYFDMDHSRLNYMDKILSLLKESLKDEPALASIYDSIKDCDVFLDYLIQKGFVGPNHAKYQEIIDAVTKYRNARLDYISNAYVFESLTDEQQYVLEHYLVAEYQKFRNNQAKAQSKLVDDVANDVENSRAVEENDVIGGRPSGS